MKESSADQTNTQADNEHHDTQGSEGASFSQALNATQWLSNRSSQARQSDILQMQRTIGNKATIQLLRQHKIIQREIPINEDEQDHDGIPTAEDYEPESPNKHHERVMNNLLSGQYTYKGQFKTKEEVIEQQTYQVFEAFIDSDLKYLLGYYLKNWSSRVENKASKGGDSSGKNVDDHPAWVATFQNQLIGQHAETDKVVAPQKSDPYEDDPLLKWDKQSEGAQRLVEAYLHAWVTQKATKEGENTDEPKHTASNVEEFIHNVGVSQTNDQALLLGGQRKLYDWCANSSGRAIALGLMRRGMRFKSYNPPKTVPQKSAPGVHLEALLNELNLQAVRFQAWGGELTGEHATKDAQATAKANAVSKGRIITGKDAWTTELKPGDFITIIFGGSVGPISGHVATVVKEDLMQSKEAIKEIGPNTDFSRVAIVSGNAAGVNQGETAIRIESFVRQRPPDEYPALFQKMVGDANIYQYQVKKKRDQALAKSEASRSAEEKALIGRGTTILAKDYPVHRVDGNKFTPGVHSPVGSDRGWVLSITRSSMLDANSMIKDGKADAAALEEQGLEIFDQESLNNPNAGLNKLYPNVLAMYE